MSNIPKVNSVSSALPSSKVSLNNVLDNRQWDKSLKTSVLPDNSIKTMQQVSFDKTPQTITNQNALLGFTKPMTATPNRELASPTAQNKAVDDISSFMPRIAHHLKDFAFGNVVNAI